MKILPILIVCLLLFSCKKEKATLASSHIVVGDLENMEYYGYSRLIQGDFFSPETFQMDFNGDGKVDIAISSAWITDNGPNLTPEIIIRTLHNQIGILSEERMDSTFRSESYTTQVSALGQIEHFATVSFSCEKESPNYFLFEVDKINAMRPRLRDEIVSREDTFVSGGYYIATPDSGGVKASIVGDTSHYSIVKVANGCNDFPEQKDSYVCFRINTGNEVKLGWIRLVYMGGNRVEMVRWAIQK